MVDCLKHACLFYIFFSIGTSILIVYCALQINGTVSLWLALYGFSMPACIFIKTNVKTEFLKCINSRKHQVSNKSMTISNVQEKKNLFDQAF